MRIIIISSLSLITYSVTSQVQQQQVILMNNISNNNIQIRGNVLNDNNFLSNQRINVQINTKILQPQRLVRNTTNVVRPVRKYNQVKAINTNKAPVAQVMRRSRPRPVPVIQANIPVTQVVTASNSNPSVISNFAVNPQVQNINLINNDDIQSLNESKIQSQQVNTYNQQDNSNVGSQINLKVDLSMNFKGRSVIRSSGGSSSSHSKAHAFSKKLAKFKRQFFGKFASHKKSKHRLDVCFNWKN